MKFNNKFEIGILNETGKYLRKKIMEDETIYRSDRAFIEKVLKEIAKIAKWIDKQDTFFTGKSYYKHLQSIGTIRSIEKLILGKRLTNVVCESIIIFEGKTGVEYELYIKKL